MKIIKAYPPNFKQIAEAFPVKGRPGLLFAYGDRIYNPSGIKITSWLLAHEDVHGKRQLIDPIFGTPMLPDEQYIQAWWDAYIEFPDFRLQEEVAAHKVEWHTFVETQFTTEHERDMYLTFMAQRLSSKLYGSLVSYWEAKRLITGEANA